MEAAGEDLFGDEERGGLDGDGSQARSFNEVSSRFIISLSLFSILDFGLEISSCIELLISFVSIYPFSFKSNKRKRESQDSGI